MKVFESIDFLGSQFNFIVKNRYSFNTRAGGIITLGILVFSAYFIYHTSSEIFVKQNPNFVKLTKVLESFPKFQLNNSFLNIPFRFEDENGTMLHDPRFFEFFLEIEINSRNITTQKMDLYRYEYRYPVNCSDVLDTKISKQYHFEDYICFDTNYTIGGDFSENDIYVPTLFARCNKNTMLKYNVTCATDSEVAKRLGAISYFSTYSQNVYLDVSNYSMPIHTYYQYTYSDIDYLDGKKGLSYKSYYNVAELETDEGILVRDISRTYFLENNNQLVAQTSSYSQYGAYFFKMSFFISKIKNTYRRTYLKFGEIVAQAGGILSLSIFIFKVCYYPIWKNEYHYYMQNSLYRLELDNNDLGGHENENNQEKQKKLELQQLSQINKDASVTQEVRKKERNDESASVPVPVPASASSSASASASASIYLKKDESGKCSRSIDESVNQLVMVNEKKLKKLSYFKKKRIFKNSEIKPLARDIVLNKDIDKVIEYKEEVRRVVKLLKWDRFCLTYCFWYKCCKQDHDLNYKARKEMLRTIEEDYKQKIDILELLKTLDRLNLMKKVILNENQCFMLQNRGLQTIVNKHSTLSKLPAEQIKAQKKKENLDKLSTYIDDKMNNYNLSSVDLLLFKYLDIDFKVELLTMLKMKNSIIFRLEDEEPQ